ncbi:uncharacterized protein ACIBXB_020006 isoform 1-T1 [Morphnus guianensis]
MSWSVFSLERPSAGLRSQHGRRAAGRRQGCPQRAAPSSRELDVSWHRFAMVALSSAMTVRDRWKESIVVCKYKLYSPNEQDAKQQQQRKGCSYCGGSVSVDSDCVRPRPVPQPPGVISLQQCCKEGRRRFPTPARVFTCMLRRCSKSYQRWCISS